MVKRISPSVKPSPQPTDRHTYHLTEGAEWGGFINVPVDEQQKAEFYAWYEGDHSAWWLIMEELLGAGIKVSLAYDGDNDSWICSLTGALVDGYAERFVTTTRAGSLGEVQALACYKHVFVVKGVYRMYNGKKKPLWG